MQVDETLSVACLAAIVSVVMHLARPRSSPQIGVHQVAMQGLTSLVGEGESLLAGRLKDTPAHSHRSTGVEHGCLFSL